MEGATRILVEQTADHVEASSREKLMGFHPLFWLIRSLFFFFTLVNQVCLLQKKYITLFYVKYADLLGNAALF